MSLVPGMSMGTSELVRSHPFIHIHFPGAWNKGGNLFILHGLCAVSLVASRDGAGELLRGWKAGPFFPELDEQKE